MSTGSYNISDKYSIWEYSKKLLGHTLEEAVGGPLTEDNTGKGRLGQMVERYFFGYEPNSNPTPDFEEAGDGSSHNGARLTLRNQGIIYPLSSAFEMTLIKRLH